MPEILINGMYMPKGNEILRVEIYPDGQVHRILGWLISEKKDAKAVELPPHGRLKDVDWIISDVRNKEETVASSGFSYEGVCADDIMASINSAPVIVEASDAI